MPESIYFPPFGGAYIPRLVFAALRFGFLDSWLGNVIAGVETEL